MRFDINQIFQAFGGELVEFVGAQIDSSHVFAIGEGVLVNILDFVVGHVQRLQAHETLEDILLYFRQIVMIQNEIMEHH